MSTSEVLVEIACKEGSRDAFSEAYRRGFAEGFKAGLIRATEKIVRNLIKQTILTDEQIALAFEVTTDYVAEIRRQLSQAH
jgi:flagellar biosynthesis/type III secretory pathway protein FliH